MGMISAAVEAVTAETAEANTHSGRQSTCNCLPPRTMIMPGLLSAEPQSSGSNSYHELCKLPRYCRSRLGWGVKDQFTLRSSFPHKPVIFHCCSAPGTDFTLWIQPSEASDPSFSLLLAVRLGSNPSWASLVRQQQCQLQDILQKF